MKRTWGLLFLLLILFSTTPLAFAPGATVAKPIDSKSVNLATGEATINKWSGAASLKVRPLDAVTRIDGKLKTATGIEVKVEQRPDGFEYSWILAAKPISNVFSLKLEFVGCTFYYQPPLNAKTYPKGWIATETEVRDDKGILRVSRPVNVVGSYAVYSDKKNGIYETGKVAHIYRPLCWDAKGSQVWGVMSIVDNVLTVTVDQVWLDKAMYPVTIDPTFGNTNIGASGTSGYFEDVLFGVKATGAVGIPTAIVAYVQIEYLGTSFKGVLVHGVNKTIVSNGVTTATALPANYTWVTAPFPAYPRSVVQDYYICLIGATNYVRIKYDTIPNLGFADATNSYASPTNPTDGGASDEYYSIYVTYYSFGYMAIGGSTYNKGVNTGTGTLFTTPAEAISGLSISFYGKAATTSNVKPGIWMGIDGGVLVKLGPPIALNSTAAWRTSTFTSPVNLNPNTTYMVAIVVDATTTIYYDATGTGKDDNTLNYATPGAFDWDNAHTNQYSIYVTFEYGPSITSSVINDFDDTNNVYSMKKNYTFTTVISDANGATDITAISVRGAQGASVRWLVDVTALTGAGSYVIGSGASVIDLDVAGCSFTEVGNTGTLVLKICFEWDATNEANCELEVWAQDSVGASVGWTTVQTNYFDVISRLVTYDHAANTTSTTINTSISVSGLVRYATTPTGDLASTSYPPDAQFTAVRIEDDQSVIVGSNSTIINGAYYTSFLSASTIRTSHYYAYLDMLPDYVDGLAPDGDVTDVTTGATFPFVDFLGNAFAFFGLVGAVTGTIYGMIFDFATWFGTSATMMVDLITTIITFIFFVGGFVISWFTRITTTLINLLTFIGSLFDGTFIPGSPNIWVLFNVSAWIDAAPIIIIILWLDSISKRHHTTGRSDIEIMVGDIQIVSYLVGEVWQWTYTVFNFVWGTLNALAARF